MNTKQLTNTTFAGDSPIYKAPCSEPLDICFCNILCTSPESGGLEDIGYEDWVVSTSANEV